MSGPTAPTDAEPDVEGGSTHPAAAGWTRFAPAPTGYLHLGHVANAIWVWGLAARTGSRVLLRIEDHDRERSRPEFDAAIVEDLTWLGFVPDAGPVRQRETAAPYLPALERLRAGGVVYACDCTRSTFAAWAEAHGRTWAGPGCPGNCRERGLIEDDELTLRVALGDGSEAWDDRCLGPQAGEPSAAGDLAVRDRHGNWTYGFAVVVDDLRQSIALVVRGEDLAVATPGQIRLARLLGRTEPPVFAHHPLIRKPDGVKLSKTDGDTGVRELRGAGRTPADVIGAAAAAVGLLAEPRPVAAMDVDRLVSVRPAPA
jgi:glutamyl/glutaminyl-tRNA synthetase